MLCNQPQVSGALGTPVLRKLLVEQEIRNTGCISHGLGHPAPVSKYLSRPDGPEQRQEYGLCPWWCVTDWVRCHSRAGVPTEAWSVAGLGSSLRGSARACHATTRAAAGDGTLHLSVSAPDSLPRLAAADMLWLVAGAHHLPLVWFVLGSRFALLVHHHLLTVKQVCATNFSLRRRAWQSLRASFRDDMHLKSLLW